MTAKILLFIILAIVIFDYLLEQWLDYLNLKNKSAPLPESLKGIYDPEKYQQSVAYHETLTRFSFLTAAFGIGVMLALLLSGGFGILDQWLAPIVEKPIFRSLVFFGILALASDVIHLPFQLYRTFVIEEKFGFNRTTGKTFILDKFKGYALTAILGGGIIGTLLYLIDRLGPNFWIYFLVVIALFMLVVNVFYTSWIVPLFNKLNPLPPGELKTAIEAYSHRIKFPIKNVLVLDGSKRSNKANAFFSGLGSRRKIVLYDTLIEKHTTEELVAVLAHEVGHYKKKHIQKGLVLSILQIAVMLFIMSKMIFNQELSVAMGGGQMAIHLNLLAFGILYSPISKVVGILGNLYSRKNEYEADAYAIQTYDGRALKTALKKLSVNNLSNLLPHDWYVFFHYSHPTLQQRLAAIDQEIEVNPKDIKTSLHPE